MKAGIWGTGFIAHTHAQSLREAGVTLAAVVDANAQRAQEFAEKWNVPAWGSDPGILFAADLTSVHVCTPPIAHGQMVRSLLEAGKHVLCEKPLCFDPAEAAELSALAKSRHLLCALNLNVRFHLACQKARRIASAEAFGPVRLIHGCYLQEYDAFPAQDNWRYHQELAGPMRAVSEIGTHWFDLAQYISGQKIQSVSAVFQNFQPERYAEQGVLYAQPDSARLPVRVDSEDAALLQLRFANGAVGSVVLSEVSHGRSNHLRLEITGEKQSLWWNAEENNLLCTAVKGAGVNHEIFAFGNGFADTFAALCSAYYADIRAGRFPETPEYPTFEDGAALARLCDAAYQSAQNNGNWVAVC